MKRIMKLSWVLLLMLTVAFVSSCKDDTSEPAVIASFTYGIDASDFMKVTFTNESKEYKSLSWDFGDASALSTEENPVHTYAALGEYTVKLTATSPGGVTDFYAEKITIADPNAELTKLVGEGNTGKTWKLIRQVSSKRYPLEVGKADYSTIWWAYGRDEQLFKRTCLLNDEWTFKRDGLKMDFDAKGDYWAEGGLFSPDNICASTTQMVGPNGEDLSAWGNGSHTFVLTPGATPTLEVVGLGAYIGLCKAATSSEVKVPQTSVKYNIIKLSDEGPTDTLIVQTAYNTGDVPPIPAYWRFVLVSYDNPSDEPPMPGEVILPNAAYKTSGVNGLTVTFTNKSTDATSYLWDFGDGQTSADENPSHTFAADGIYQISLKATNADGESSTKSIAAVSSTILTDAILQGAPWKIRVEENSIFVGPALFNNAWWATPKNFLTSGVGTEDWTCMTDDEFTFAAGGVFTYDTKGSARNDGYFGGTNGCIDDAAIAASGNGAAFGSATHSYVFTAGGKKGIKSLPSILLTNGAGKAAFIGFYKGYYGGENTNSANLPNGGNATNVYQVQYAKVGAKEYLLVSVDLSSDHSDGNGWSAILER
jgi:PKD repeat protein